MSVILPADHHATFDGWTRSNSQDAEKQKDWSSRQRIGFLILCTIASWLVVLSPFLLFS